MKEESGKFLLNKKENNLEVLGKEIDMLKPEKVKELAERKAKEFLGHLDDLSKDIERAESLTQRAKNAKGGFLGLGKTKEQTQINTEAISLQNQAMRRINDLIQENIKLTTCSFAFASAMTTTIAGMLANGFEDSNGRIRKLSGVAKDQANFLLSEAKRFVDHQREYEERQEEQEAKIVELQETIDRDRQDKKQIDDIQEKNIEQNRNDIDDLRNQVQSKSLKLQAIKEENQEQEKNIEQNRNDIDDLRNQVQSKSLKLQAIKEENQEQNARFTTIEERIANLESKSQSQNTRLIVFLILSLCALIVGIVNIVLLLK